jgi:hypothetical protein
MSYRATVANNWPEYRCEPGVIPLAGLFKPPKDPRTSAQFAQDNWTFCQKEYIQNGLRIAAEVPKELVQMANATAGSVTGVTGILTDVFVDLWTFCYEAYASFMERMKGVGRLFQNFIINMHSIVDRLQASVLSIVYALISLITAFVNSVHMAIIVAVVILGILIALQIILFFILPEIFGIIIAMTAIIPPIVIAASSEMFTPGACFTPDTPVKIHSGSTKPIAKMQVGDRLADGGFVTAVHQFLTADDLYELDGVHVTGDHLVTNMYSKHLSPVRDYPIANRIPMTLMERFKGGRDLWCLTTTTRRIPCGPRLFADWEEIPDDDVSRQTEWFRAVWDTLNPKRPCPEPSARILESTAGLSPDCRVQRIGWRGPDLVYLKDVEIGDVISDRPGHTTRVVGKVCIEGDQEMDALMIEGGLVTPATWILRSNDVWQPAASLPAAEIHPRTWIHLYTESGEFMLASGLRVRDAAEVGLAGLRPLVDAIVLRRDAP